MTCKFLCSRLFSLQQNGFVIIKMHSRSESLLNVHRIAENGVNIRFDYYTVCSGL